MADPEDPTPSLSEILDPAAPEDGDEGPVTPFQGVVTDYARMPEKGLEELRKLVERDPENFHLKDMLAFHLYSRSQLDEALEIYRDLLSAGYRPDQQRLSIGNIYFKKNLVQLAIKEWEWILQSEDADPRLKAKARERIDKIPEP